MNIQYCIALLALTVFALTDIVRQQCIISLLLKLLVPFFRCYCEDKFNKNILVKKEPLIPFSRVSCSYVTFLAT